MDPYDPDSHNILSEESILTLLKYYRELKKVYSEFFQTNFNEKAIVRPWKVIQQENEPVRKNSKIDDGEMFLEVLSYISPDDSSLQY